MAELLSSPQGPMAADTEPRLTADFPEVSGSKVARPRSHRSQTIEQESALPALQSDGVGFSSTRVGTAGNVSFVSSVLLCCAVAGHVALAGKGCDL